MTQTSPLKRDRRPPRRIGTLAKQAMPAMTFRVAVGALLLCGLAASRSHAWTMALAAGSIATLFHGAALCQHLVSRCLPTMASSQRSVCALTWVVSLQICLCACWRMYVSLCDRIEPLELGASDLAGLVGHTSHENGWPPFMTRPVVFRAAASSLVERGLWPPWDEFQPRRWSRRFEDPKVSVHGLPESGDGARFHYVDTERDALVRPAATLLSLQEVLDTWAHGDQGNQNETLYLQDRAWNAAQSIGASNVFQANVQALLLPRLRKESGFDRIPHSLPLSATSGSLRRWQLHVGAHRGRGSVHNDFEDNVVVQLGGRKRWRMFHPLATPSMGLRPLPELVATRDSPGNYSFGRVQRHGEPCNHNYPQTPHTARAQDVPSIEITLERGDVMLLPGLWWHDVQRLPLKRSGPTTTPSAIESGGVHEADSTHGLADEFNVAMSLFYELPWTRAYRDAWFVLNTAGVRGLVCAAVAQAAGVHPAQLAAFFRNRWCFDEPSGRCLVRCDQPAGAATKAPTDAHKTGALPSRWMEVCTAFMSS